MIHETLPAAEETARKRRLVGEIVGRTTTTIDKQEPEEEEKIADSFIYAATRLYEAGLSAFDLVDFVATDGRFNADFKTRLLMHFHVIRSQHRCEKMLIFAVLQQLRSDTSY
jgi:hypothetical protein